MNRVSYLAAWNPREFQSQVGNFSSVNNKVITIFLTVKNCKDSVLRIKHFSYVTTAGEGNE